MMKKIICMMFMLVVSISGYATQFEELEKPPEGAHEGQIMLGGYATIGVPYGRIINAENSYIRNSTYTFINNLVTKKIMAQYLSFSYGIFFEYMPVDYMGIKFMARRASIVQRSRFGSEYQNWSKLMYSDYSFLIGPAIHFTTRKQWDISVTPVAGYAIGEYTAAPLAGRLIYNSIGFRKKKANNPVVGTELNLSLFFSGGFLISFGCDWTMNILKFGGKFYVYNLQTYKSFFPNGNSSLINSISFTIGAGYAFSN
jgi:hypothetical protein